MNPPSKLVVGPRRCSDKIPSELLEKFRAGKLAQSINVKGFRDLWKNEDAKFEEVFEEIGI